MGILRIIRGLPGSGKSTLAKSFNTVHFESDMYLINDDKYIWTPERLERSIEMCFKQASECMEFGIDVVVSGVFTKPKTFRKYLEKAKEFGYDVTVIKCCNDFGNIHNVPKKILENMANAWEDFDGEMTHYADIKPFNGATHDSY